MERYVDLMEARVSRNAWAMTCWTKPAKTCDAESELRKWKKVLAGGRAAFVGIPEALGMDSYVASAGTVGKVCSWASA